ncbi:MAG TPA: transcription antitermination factor NusB [Thermodesulfobacteriota bacterium]|nr:transcription antitermination factor NusB [Thermodesulfobacteriota bacterium]
MSVRRRAREIALQVLYQLDIAPGDPGEAVDRTFESFRSSESAREFCWRLVDGVTRKKQEIDRLIEDNAENWTLKRMAVVDRNILRLATFELLYCPDIPFRASLNEAVELAKAYGSDDSGGFINGILDRIHSLAAAKLPPESDET